MFAVKVTVTKLMVMYIGGKTERRDQFMKKWKYFGRMTC